MPASVVLLVVGLVILFGAGAAGIANITRAQNDMFKGDFDQAFNSFGGAFARHGLIGLVASFGGLMALIGGIWTAVTVAQNAGLL